MIWYDLIYKNDVKMTFYLLRQKNVQNKNT